MTSYSHRIVGKAAWENEIEMRLPCSRGGARLLVILILLRVLLGACLIAFLGYCPLSIWAARQWRRSAPPISRDWTPPVTVLKPVRGVDAEAYANFVSFCRQDYPQDCIQLVFGALDPADPALTLVRQLQNEFPSLDIRLVCRGTEAILGPNLKICNLAAMLPEARHELLVLCDSDMRVDPDYLRRVVAPFKPERGGETQESALMPSTPEQGREGAHGEATGGPDGVRTEPGGVGLVTCPYRGARVRSAAAIAEALGIGAEFIPNALVSRMLEGVGFAFGSTIALPRSVLKEIGGFESLVDELADDFRLGAGVKQAGYEVVLSDYVVQDVLGPEHFGAMWARRLRWARTVRACRPAGYAGALITHGAPLALVFLAATGFTRFGWEALAVVLLARLVTALSIALCYTRDPNVVRFLPLLPLSDLLSFALYIVSFCGNQILWRGERFRLLPGGKLAPPMNRKL